MPVMLSTPTAGACGAAKALNFASIAARIPQENGHDIFHHTFTARLPINALLPISLDDEDGAHSFVIKIPPGLFATYASEWACRCLLYLFRAPRLSAHYLRRRLARAASAPARPSLLHARTNCHRATMMRWRISAPASYAELIAAAFATSISRGVSRPGITMPAQR